MVCLGIQSYFQERFESSAVVRQVLIAMLALFPLLTLPLLAAEPIRLRVIPYRPGSSPQAHQFDGVLQPPPMPLGVSSSKPRSSNRVVRSDVDDVDESDWLME